MKIGGQLKRMEFFLLLSILLIIASIVITVYHVRQKREATDLVIHTYAVIQIGNDVYSQLLEIENDRIQYYVKGDTSVKESFVLAQQKLQRDIEELKSLVKIPQAVTIMNDKIIPLINERLISDKLNSVTPAVAAIKFPYLTDQKLMNEVQEAFQKLDAIESEALVERQADLSRIYRFSSYFLLISFGLIGITSAIAWISLRSRQKEIDHLLDSLQEWNLSLERKVDERTKEISTINQQLLAINEEKDNFIGIVSHDLKSPVTGIQNLVQLMKAQNKSSNEQEYLELIQESCQHMQTLISEILDVNRIDQGLQSLAPKHMAIADLVIRLQKYYDVMAREKQISLLVQVSAHDLTCFTDESILYQILSNLVSNAIKFSKPFSKVELNVSQQQTHFLFEVKDHGPGIETNEIPLLFKKFQKLKARPTGGESSTGLGLFIVNRLVQLLNGKVEVKSVPNHQTSFTVSIPQ
jgi:signal transduction histidine kinase